MLTDYTLAHLDNFDGVGLGWSTDNGGWSLSVDIYDDEMGQVLRRLKTGISYNWLLPGDVHHATVEYNRSETLFRVLIKDDTGRVVYDTGKFPLVSQDRTRTLKLPFEVDEIAFKAFSSGRARRGEIIEWRGAQGGDGYIYMFGALYSQAGYLKVGGQYES